MPNPQPWVDLIWAIQPIGSPGEIELFHTDRLAVNSIHRPYFSGNPLLLMHYLSDLFLKHVIIRLEEAEALAAYLMWEAKEYDPTGKQSDILTLRMDGSIGRLDRGQLVYWEEHFEHFKESLRLLPIISCTLTETVYNPKDRLQRFVTTIETLYQEQLKMRAHASPRRTELEAELYKNIRETAMKFLEEKARQSPQQAPEPKQEP